MAKGMTSQVLCVGSFTVKPSALCRLIHGETW